jgi:hypothetical protein
VGWKGEAAELWVKSLLCPGAPRQILIMLEKPEYSKPEKCEMSLVNICVFNLPNAVNFEQWRSI